MSSYATPRLMLAAASSGTGKTTAMMALLSAAASMGMTVQPFKTGPDFVDPRFHEAATTRRSHNLDGWLMAPSLIGSTLAEASLGADLSLIEGVMGLYDGLEHTDRCSSAEMARLTKTPVVLLVDGRGMARSAAALVKGYLTFDEARPVKAVIFTRVSGQAHADLLERACQSLGVIMAGWLPELKGHELDHRPLGLVRPEEEALKELIVRLGEGAQKNIRWELLLHLAHSAPSLEASSQPLWKLNRPVTIARACDDAFDADYGAALAELERCGVQWRLFSPLKEAVPPADGLWLRGGGTLRLLPEVAKNAAFLTSLAHAANRGLPIWAEGLGAACLACSALCEEGEHLLSGVLNWRVSAAERKTAFGYVVLRGENFGQVPAHEFRYWSFDDRAEPCNIEALKERSTGLKRWPAGLIRGSLVALAAHCHPFGTVEALQQWLHCVAKQS